MLNRQPVAGRSFDKAEGARGSDLSRLKLPEEMLVTYNEKD